MLGYVGAAATKSIMPGLLILATARLLVPYAIAHLLWMPCFLLLTTVSFSLFGFIIGLCLVAVGWSFRTGYKLEA